jgi:hypothetical protein
MSSMGARAAATSVMVETFVLKPENEAHPKAMPAYAP